ncbi:MAG: hypothetical protein HBSAPP03_08950 [Phycisphaerae bacterium]|nr:MAG: hypothetical protein HBSAPP03_08950 [Phycisphaerae bacterium]
MDMEINACNAAGLGRVADAAPMRAARHPDADVSAPRRGADRVDLSPDAQLLASLRDLPARQDLVDAIRGEIARGEYDTPEKLDAALEELLRDVL